MKWAKQTSKGFTIVELLIVVVVIAILAAITIVAYNGIQNRAKNSATQSSVRQVQNLVEAYAAENGSYPSTGGMDRVYTDANCAFTADDNGAKQVAWVPGLTAQLPQSSFSGTGRNGVGGCYAYSSDGTTYVISAWNAKYGGPSTDAMYRRIGYRETNFFSANNTLCNHNGTIGGLTGSTYNANIDFYKFSYTVSNMTSCNETPPAGA